MTDKTREAMANVLTDFEVEGLDHTEALAKICAIVDKEREGEVVLGPAVCIGAAGQLATFKQLTEGARASTIKGKTGRLIFVPDQEGK